MTGRSPCSCDASSPPAAREAAFVVGRRFVSPSPASQEGDTSVAPTKPRRRRRRYDGTRGFTLIEVVLAMALVAIIASALYSAMHIAILAKRSASAAVEPTRAVVIA